jgi:hypothetical protein
VPCIKEMMMMMMIIGILVYQENTKLRRYRKQPY